MASGAAPTGAGSASDLQIDLHVYIRRARAMEVASGSRTETRNLVSASDTGVGGDPLDRLGEGLQSLSPPPPTPVKNVSLGR